MDFGALIILGIWAFFVVAYIVARTLWPNLAKGTRRISKIKNITKYDEDGFDKNGFSALGFHRNGTRYDDNGYDRFGNPRPAGERTDLRIHEPVEDSGFNFEETEKQDDKLFSED